MAIGQRMDSLKNLKSSLKKGGGSTWVKFIPKNGSMNVRFIEEPENWINYVEHFDTTLRRSFPCNGESGCPGCITGERKSNRYLTNAVDVDQDKVIPLQLPKDLANRLVVRYERNGTLTDRDFELSRNGEGLDTVYDLDAGAQDRKKIDKYVPIDLMKVLEEAYSDMFAPTDTDEAPTVAPAAVKALKRTKAAVKAVPAKDDEPEVDTDDGPLDTEPVVTKRPKAGAKKTVAKVEAKPEPDFTPEDDGDEDDDEDDEGYDEETLRALPLGALRAVAREFGIDPKGQASDAIVDAIMAAGEPLDDDEG